MTAILNALRTFFTTGQRQKLYAAAALLVPLLVTYGLLSEGAGNQILAVIGAVLGLGVALVQIANFQARTLASWFVNVGRAALYTFAGVAIPALVFFDLLSPDAGSAALAALSSFLSTLAALIGIIYAPDVSEDVTD